MYTNKKLAKIKKANLEILDRGILNFWIHVEYEECGFSQGVGGIALDSWCETKKKRVGTAYGCELIRRILLALAVDDFSKMAGKYIWVLGNGDGLSFTPKGIQRLRVDGGESGSDAVIFDEIAAEFGL